MFDSLKDQMKAERIPHSNCGDLNCRGHLTGLTRGDWAEVVCNECGAVVRTVPVSELGKTLTQMELSLELATAICPRCGAVNLLPDFTNVVAFVCEQCGLGVGSAERLL